MKTWRRQLLLAAGLAALVTLHLVVHDTLARSLAAKWAHSSYKPPTNADITRTMRAHSPSISPIPDEHLLGWLKPEFRESTTREFARSDLGRAIERAQQAADELPNWHWRRHLSNTRQHTNFLFLLVFGVAYAVIARRILADPYRWARQKMKFRSQERALEQREAAFVRARRLFDAGLLSDAEFERARKDLRQAIEESGLGDRQTGFEDEPASGTSSR